MRIRAYPLTITAVALLAGTAAAVAFAGGTVPSKDSFHGKITTARGSFVGDSGHVSLQVNVSQSSTATRTATVILTGRPCHGSGGCIRLNGVLTGTLTRMPTIPDVGASFAVRASGRIKPLGHVSATGLLHGTGFIMHGHETLTLRLSNSRGEVDLHAQSPAVPGFTSP